MMSPKTKLKNIGIHLPLTREENQPPFYTGENRQRQRQDKGTPPCQTMIPRFCLPTNNKRDIDEKDYIYNTNSISSLLIIKIGKKKDPHRFSPFNLFDYTYT